MIIYEIVKVASYPPPPPAPDRKKYPDNKTHKAACAVAEESYNRRKAHYEGSCRVDGCSNDPKRTGTRPRPNESVGSKFCGRHLHLRRQIPREEYNKLGPGVKLKVG